MGYSIIDICNLALSRVGARTISDLNEGSSEANFCSRFYPIARDDVLSNFPWNFAQNTVTLAQTTSYTDPRWLYTYQYPSQALSVQKVYNPNDEDSPTYADMAMYGNFSLSMPMNRNAEQRFRGPKFKTVTDGTNKYVLSNIAEAAADIAISIQDPSLFSPSFISALSCRLAWDIVMPLTGILERKAQIEKDYAYLLNSAYLQNAGEDNNPPDHNHRYSNARR